MRDMAWLHGTAWALVLRHCEALCGTMIDLRAFAYVFYAHQNMYTRPKTRERTFDLDHGR